MHLRLEAEVDHAVGLVHDDVVTLVEHRVALLQAVDQPPWSRDDDLAALAQLEALVLDALTCADRSYIACQAAIMSAGRVASPTDEVGVGALRGVRA